MQHSYKHCYLRLLWDHSTDVLPLAHISGMHLASWVCEFKSALLPQATEDILVMRFEEQTLCVHLKAYTPLLTELWGFQADPLINAGSYTEAEVYGDEYTQECGRVKSGTVVVIYITAWSLSFLFFFSPLYWPKHVNLSHVTHKCH